MSSRLFLSLLLLVLTSDLLAQSPRTLRADKNPAFLFTDPVAGRVHLLTLGVDRNFNTVFEADSGDIPPRWLVIDPATETTVDSVTFSGFFNSFPIRPGIDLYGRRLYLPQLGRVRSFDLDTRMMMRDTVVIGNYTAATYDSITATLQLAFRPGYTTPGHVVLFDPDADDTLAIYAAGVNPQMSVSDGDRDDRSGIHLTINEGNAQTKSTISYSSYHPSIYSISNPDTLGGVGNDLVVDGERVYAVMNGSHEIKVINSLTHREEEYSPINVGTSGLDGPRSLALQGDSLLLVTTYAGDLRRFKAATGEPVDTILLPGKGERLVVRDSLAFVLVPLRADYSNDSIVVVINLNSGRVIETVGVGLSPADILVDKRGDLQILIADTGDVHSSLVTLDGITYAVKSRFSLPGFIPYGTGLAYDAADDSLYVVVNDTVFVLSAATPALFRRPIYIDSSTSRGLLGLSLVDGYLLVTERPANFGTGAGTVHLIDRASGEREASFQAGTFLNTARRIQTNRTSALSFYALNEGNFGGRNSTLTFFEFNSDILANDSLGYGANHLFLDDEVAGVTMSGSHNITAVNPYEGTVLLRIPTGTSGFDGPREAMFYKEKDVLLFTTYAGDVGAIGPDEVLRRYPTQGKAEGITEINNKVFVANISAPDYSPDSTVSIFDIETLTASVERESPIASATTLHGNYPNPASMQTDIRFSLAEASHVTLVLYSAHGEKIKTLADGDMQPGRYSVDIRLGGLASGSYIYTLHTGSTTVSRTMKVVR